MTIWYFLTNVGIIFCHLCNSAKIIGNTENFSNFILGYHDMVF